jgi:hypothetical protein
MTGGTFGLQRIADLDAPLAADASQVETVASANVTADALDWFEAQRLRIVDVMKSSAEGRRLGQRCDFNFTTRARPPDGVPAALVVTGGTYLGMQLPYTVIARRLVFVP